MPTDAKPPRSVNETRVLDFARAFRSAARAVGFYPPTHQAVVAALDQVAAAARAAASDGPLCLTILPQAFLAGGLQMDSTETVVADLAGVCHRHGVGAVILDGRATNEAWQAFFALLARKPEEVRGLGGIQRQWKALRHRSPGILEIDFGALLRGQVGGDFLELAAVISHYLETAGVGGSILDDPCGALRRAIDNATDGAQAIAAMLRELRAAAQLTFTRPDQFDDVFRRAAAVGEFLTEALMSGLLDRRGTPEAMVGTLDVVRALVERMPDATVSTFLSKAMGDAGASSSRLTDMFRSLVPNPDRRRIIVHGAQDVTLEGNVADQWAELARNLEAYADRRFISEEYGDELHALQNRGDGPQPACEDPPERLAGWVRSISDEAVHELDLQLLADLARAETEAPRLKKVLDILQATFHETAGEGDWAAAAHAIEAVQGVANDAPDGTSRLLAAEILQKLGASADAERALAALSDPNAQAIGMLVRVLGAVGFALMPAIAQRWAAERHAPVRSRLEQIVTTAGKPGREALRRMLASDDEAAELRIAAMRLIELTPGTEHLPALEAALSDQRDDVRAEAFRALAASSSDRACEILARGIARADAAAQPLLLARLMGLGESRARPVLQRLVPQIDPQTAPVPMCLAMIAALERAGGGETESMLLGLVARTRWRAPMRAWRIRSAAQAAIRAARARASSPPDAAGAGGGR
jgi:hypothetical protein